MASALSNTLNRSQLIGRIILAAVLGELALILLTTIAQEVLFNGIDYNTSSLFEIFFGGLATFIAAILAGLLTSYIVKGSTMTPHWIISAFIVAEMTYLIASEVLTGPIWFEILSGLSLIVGVLAGHFAYKSFHASN
jgi:hypothetical protein